MPISERKMKIAIENYFKNECDINTSIHAAFEKGFRIGVKQGQLVSAEPQWIPCSERLPNHDEYIKNNGLFNVSDGDRSYSEWFDICDKQRFGEYTMAGFRADDAVIAWMPLPNPYKGDKG